MNFQRLLFLNRSTLSPSVEWEISLSEWRFIRLSQGFGYWMGGSVVEELHEAEVLVIPPGASGRMRASQLGQLSFHYFDFAPEILTGFLTLAEQQYFEMLGRHGRPRVRVIPAAHKSSEEFTALVAASAQMSVLVLRCRMLHLTAAMFAEGITLHESEMLPASSVEARFKELITEMPDGELLERTPEELARICGCSLRHFSRLFRRHFEVSLRAKQTELRLLKARQLLSNTDTKIIHVALESGYRHLGLFNAMVKRYIGVTPSAFRPKQHEQAANGWRIPAAMMITGLLLIWAPAGNAADVAVNTGS